MMMYSRAPGWLCSMVSVGACAAMAPLLDRDQIDDRENNDPDDVDKVPVQSCDLDVQAPGLSHDPPPGQHEQREQPDDSERDVGAVESGQHEERRAKGAHRKVQTFGAERRELEDLPTDK